MGLLLNIDIDFDIIALSEIGQINCENIANLLKSTHKFDCQTQSDIWWCGYLCKESFSYG